MFFLPTSGVLEQLGLGPEDEDSMDEALRRWVESMRTYNEDYSAPGAPTCRFWLIIRVKKENFAERIMLHPEIPMILPTEGNGELVGVVSSREEVDAITTPGKQGADAYKKDFFYLTYQAKVKGSLAWRNLLEFLAHNNMLEKDKSM